MLVPSTLYVIIEHIPRPQENKQHSPGRSKAFHGITDAQQIRREKERKAQTLFATANMVLAMHRPQKDLSTA
jgi:hypothetical protein